MMSAAQGQSRLESLECHFTWNLDASRSELFSVRDALVDIGTEKGNIWLGHIYNLQGFIHYKLGFIEEARDFFSRATETFHELGDADEGPWLVVNYGNLAWLHQHLGEDRESQGYLSKLDTLMEKSPPPVQGELHPEVCAEKAWTLMKFDKDKKLQAADYFQRAIRMKPDIVEWQTSRVLVFVKAYIYDNNDLDADILDSSNIRKAREEDRGNLQLAAVDLLLRAKRGEKVRDEADDLGEKILLNPVSSYSGIRTLMRVYRQLDCYDEAIELAEKALKKHPDERYLKRCATLCYRWRITFVKASPLSESMISRAISLYEEVVPLYPHSCLLMEIEFANILAKSVNSLMRADQMYQEMMARDLEPEDKQMLYNYYARNLYNDQKEYQKSIDYHMKAAEIPHKSYFQQNSINTLKKIRDRGRGRMCREIREFLKKLPDSESTAAQGHSRLESLECHFTWNLDASRSKLFSVRDTLVDIGTEEGNIWLGHIYNLQGFIHYKLGFIEEARDFFSRATETFHQLGDADEGPWLVVNFGNLAWLHQHMGEDRESQGYLSKLDTLMEKSPPPVQDELHPEVCAQKAWTLMTFYKLMKLQAADYFQRAIRMKPDMVEWKTSRVLALMSAYKYNDNIQDVDLLEEIRNAQKEDPGNLQLAAVDLLLRAKRGEEVRDEADDLGEKILLNPVSSYSGIRTLMSVYRQLDCYDEAIELAEKAIKKHPDERYLKRCATLCYGWGIIFVKGSPLSESRISRAISLHEDVVSLYPHSSLLKEINLANMLAKSDHGLMRADQMYQEMMERDLEPASRQMLYNCYAKYLYYDQRENEMSIEYHMKAAEIPHHSFFRQISINVLQRISEQGKHRRHREIQEFLKNLD